MFKNDSREFYRDSRNPYWAKLREEPLKNSVFCDEETEKNQNQWLSFFSENQSFEKLIVEIGCNGGHLLTAAAEESPNHAFLGIEWKFKQVYRAFEKKQKKNCRNAIFLRANAVRIQNIFGLEECDEVWIFFPDPWSKKAQRKNRLLNREFLINLSKILKKGGRLWFKTDHEEYFDSTVEILESTLGASFWDHFKITRDIHKNNPESHKMTLPQVTLFEKIFIKEGKPIFELQGWTKR